MSEIPLVAISPEEFEIELVPVLQIPLSDVATVATTGDYNDLINKPTIPTIPTLAEVALSGDYTDLLNKPTIPTSATQIGGVVAEEGKRLITTAEANKLSSIAADATANHADSYLLARTNHTGTQPIDTVEGLPAALVAKVSVETGKGLSKNDYTDGEKAKLASLSNFDPSSLQTSIATKVDKVEGKGLSANDYTTSEKTKLAGLFNYDDDALADRVTAAEDDITELQAAYNSATSAVDTLNTTKVDKVTGKGLSANDYTSVEKTKLAALNNYDDTAVRGLIATKQDSVAGKGLSANDYSNAEKAIVTALTGFDPAALQAQVDNKVTKITGKSLSTEDFTTTEKTKLASLSPYDASAVTARVDALETGKVDKATGMALSSNDYTGTEKTKLAGLSNYNDAELRGHVTTLETSFADLDTRKVEKVAGKALSTNDYTTTEKTKLAGLANYNDTAVLAAIAANTTKLNGIAAGATANNTDAYLLNRTNHTGTQAISTVTGLQTALDAKVAIVTGKQLSTEDYTTVEKTKLASLANYNDVPLQTAIIASLDLKVDKVTGKGLSTNDYITDDKTKLAGIAFNATSNATDAFLINRTNHVGTQEIATVNGLQTALNSKVASVAGKQLSTEDYSTAEKTKLAGLSNYSDVALAARVTAAETAATTLTGRVTANEAAIATKQTAVAGKGLSTEDYTTTEKTKLAGLSNYNDTALVATVATKVDKVPGKGLSTADFTAEEKTKLASLGNYNDSALQDLVNTKVDKITGKGLSTQDYTTAEQTKLAGIAAGATVNSTDAVLKDRANHTGTQAISTVTGLQTALDAKAAAVAGKQLSTEDYTTAEKIKLAGLTAGGGGGGSYTDAQAAVAGLGAMRRVDLSAYGDATTSAHVGFQSIIAAGNVVYVPPGKTIMVNDALVTLSASVPRCHIVNDGILVYSKTSRMFTVDQPFDATINVTAIADVTYNSELMTRLTLASVTGLVIDNIIKIFCDAKYPWVDPNGDVPFIAETVRISAIDVANNYVYVPTLVWTTNIAAATTMRIARQFEFAFTLTGTGMISGDASPDSVTYNTSLEAFKLQGVVDPLILHRFKDNWGIGVRAESTYQGRFVMDFSGQKNDVTGTPKIYGYGLHYGRGCTGGLINIQARDGRHPFTSDFDDSKATFAASAIKDFGGPMFPLITGSAIGTRGTAFDTHAFVGFPTFVNCKVTGVRVSPTGSGVSGINNRGYGTTIINADVRNCSVGINDDSFGQNTGKKFSTLIQGGRLDGNTYGVKAGGVQLIAGVLTPELNHRLTIQNVCVNDATQAIQLDISGAQVNIIGLVTSKIADVSVGLETDAFVHETGRIEDRSQFGTARDGATGNGLYKIKAALTTNSGIDCFDYTIYGSTSRPTAIITGSGTAPAMGALRVGGGKLPDRTTGLTSVSACTVSSYIDLDSPPGNRTTSTAYTFTLLDAKRTVEFNSTSATTATIPLGLDVPIGAQFVGVRMNTGTVTIAAAAGVTINKASATLAVAAQYGEFVLTKTDVNVYRLSGALT